MVTVSPVFFCFEPRVWSTLASDRQFFLELLCSRSRAKYLVCELSVPIFTRAHVSSPTHMTSLSTRIYMKYHYAVCESACGQTQTIAQKKCSWSPLCTKISMKISLLNTSSMYEDILSVCRWFVPFHSDHLSSAVRETPISSSLTLLHILALNVLFV